MSDLQESAERLAEIARLSLGTADARHLLDELAAAASKLLELPIGLVSVVLSDAQWFVGQKGLSGWLAAVGGTPREWSFCSTVVETGEPLVVPDAATDPRFASNLLVVHEGVRCYVGVPLITQAGHVIGSLCAIGDAARKVESRQIASLRQLAVRAMQSLESLPGRQVSAC